MADSIPEYIRDLRTDIGVDFVKLYKGGLEAIATLAPDQYPAVLALTMKLGEREFKGIQKSQPKVQLIIGKEAADLTHLEGVTKVFLTAVQLAEMIPEYIGLVTALSNLGIIFSNNRVFDVALVFAQRAVEIARKQKKKDMEITALRVTGMIYTNTSQTELQIKNMERVIQLKRETGKEEEAMQLESQLGALKSMFKLLGKS
ncbi:MAG: hypothetical protein GF411_20330 [Candidatus Lokiarchaeota archaeon]|nr:hypothetical protein [Candidatus Lokiarchaeota archaeon]